jgi:hypothetical protein
LEMRPSRARYDELNPAKALQFDKGLMGNG